MFVRALTQFSFALTLLASLPIFAASSPHILLQEQHRPPMAQVMTLLELPFPEEDSGDDNLFDNVSKYGPKVIAQLEFLFPDGVYVPLGRDTAFLADTLEAFYLRYGHKNRVGRFNASTPTVDGVTAAQMKKLILATGFDRNRPYALIDRTSFSSGSQSTQILKSIYKMSPKPYQAYVISTEAGVKMTTRVRNPKQILAKAKPERHSPPEEPIYLDDFAPFTDLGSEWHGSFMGSIVKDPRGKWSGRPGPPSQTIKRKTAVNEMWKISRIVSSPEFLRDVVSEGKKYGLNIRQRLTNKGQLPSKLSLRLFEAETEMFTSMEREISDALPQVNSEYYTDDDHTPPPIRSRIYSLQSARRNELMKIIRGLKRNGVVKTQKKFDAYMGHWQERFDNFEGMDSPVARAMIDVLTQIDPFSYDVSTSTGRKRAHRGQHFSPGHGALVEEILNDWEAGFSVKDVLDIDSEVKQNIKHIVGVLLKAESLKLITSRDLRNLGHHVLSILIENMETEYGDFGYLMKDVFKFHPEFQRMLLFEMPRLIVNTRYHGSGRRIYALLLDNDVMQPTKANCAKWLGTKKDN